MAHLFGTAKETAPGVFACGGSLDVPRFATQLMRTEKVDFVCVLHQSNAFGSDSAAVSCNGARENKVSGRILKKMEENTHYGQSMPFPSASKALIKRSAGIVSRGKTE